jgi:hypothetical protein
MRVDEGADSSGGQKQAEVGCWAVHQRCIHSVRAFGEGWMSPAVTDRCAAAFQSRCPAGAWQVAGSSIPCLFAVL